MKRNNILLIFFAFVAVAVPVTIIWPSLSTIHNTSEAIYREYEFLEQRRKRGQDIQRARKEYDELKPALDTVDSLAVSAGDELRFITALEALAEQRGVTARLDLNIEGLEKKSQYHKLPFAMTVDGNYRNVLQFLAELRTLPMAVSITTASMSAASVTRNQPAGPSAVNARFDGAIYIHPSE